MKRIIPFVIILMLLCGVSVWAETIRDFNTMPQGTNVVMDIRVDSVDYRGDLTRLYGMLIGKPHTSNRIDRVVLTDSIGGRVIAIDIDGVDLGRWFQWESNGLIPIEIDFPAMNVTQRFELESIGPKEYGKWNVIKSDKK